MKTISLPFPHVLLFDCIDPGHQLTLEAIARGVIPVEGAGSNDLESLHRRLHLLTDLNESCELTEFRDE